MPSSGPDFHVFVIRARQERREIPAAPPEWRFWVEHHPGGQQRNSRDFQGVLEFIGLYLPGSALAPTPPDHRSSVRP